MPNDKLSKDAFIKAQRTIDSLGLNQSRYCVSREQRIKRFLKGDVNAAFMQSESPYLWSEIQRLNLEPLS